MPELPMKGRYDLFGFLAIIGVAAILIAMAVSLFFRGWPLNEKVAMLGVWVILSFLIMVGVEGSARGIARHKIAVPWKLAVPSFLLAALLLIIAKFIDVT